MKKSLKQKVTKGKLAVREIAETMLVAVFIVDAVAIALNLFGTYQFNAGLSDVAGAILVGYALVAFWVVLRRGVKYQLSK